MDSLWWSRVTLVLFLSLFTLVAVVWPTLRLRRRTGSTGYVAHLAPTPVHQFAVQGLGAVVGGLLLWTGLFLFREPATLGIWAVPPELTALGWSLMVATLVLVVAAQRQMGASWRVGIDPTQPTGLVTHGLFARVRNPIFTGMIGSALGLVAVMPSAWTVLGWWFLVYVLGLQVRLEEEHLLALHGARYREYASRVGRFVPGVGRLSSSSARGQGPSAEG